jgi:hypothetical protein
MYTIEELKKALENRKACLAYLSDADGMPKLCADKESFDANMAAVWAIEQAIERLEDS